MRSRHLIHNHVVGYVTAGDRLARIVGDNHILDSVGLAQLADLRAGQAPGVFMAGVVREPDVADPLDPSVRPRMEHSVVQDAVDSDCSANAEGERKDCGEREARVADDLPERKAEILEHHLHQRLLSLGKEDSQPVVRAEAFQLPVFGPARTMSIRRVMQKNARRQRMRIFDLLLRRSRNNDGIPLNDNPADLA
jgi:hypothetical protein